MKTHLLEPVIYAVLCGVFSLCAMVLFEIHLPWGGGTALFLTFISYVLHVASVREINKK